MDLLKNKGQKTFMKLKEMIKEDQGKNNVKSKNVTKYNPYIFPIFLIMFNC